MADQALSDLPAITNINTDDLILISQNAGVGVYNSRQISANNFDMVSGVRNYGTTTSDPSSPTPQDGDIYYNTNNKVWKYYDSGRSSWVVISSFASSETRLTRLSAGIFGLRSRLGLKFRTISPLLRQGACRIGVPIRSTTRSWLIL